MKLREYVKNESRRIRLKGVRSKVLIIDFKENIELPYLNALLWADITIIRKTFKEINEKTKEIIAEYCNNSSLNGIIILNPDEINIQYLYDLIPIEKDILCKSTKAIATDFSYDKICNLPCLTDAVFRLLRFYDIEFRDKKISIFGMNNDLRKLALCFMNSGSAVMCVPTAFNDKYMIASKSDIIITMQNTPLSMDERCFDSGQTVIDLGKVKNSYGYVGDIDFKAAEKYVDNIFIDANKQIEGICNYVLVSNILRNASKLTDK